MGLRTLLRQFAAHNSCSPAAWLRHEWIGVPCEPLGQTAFDVESVAARCGIAPLETFRAAFRPEAQTSPIAYRRRFRRPLASHSLVSRR